MTMPINPYTRKKLRAWSAQQKCDYYDAYRRGNERLMVAMTPDVEGDSNERRIARNNLRFWVGEELKGISASRSDLLARTEHITGEQYGNPSH